MERNCVANDVLEVVREYLQIPSFQDTCLRISFRAKSKTVENI